MDANEFMSVVFENCKGTPVWCTKKDMRGRRWYLDRKLEGEMYFCISTINDPNPYDDILSRTASNLCLTYCVVLDDIGTKVSRETAAHFLPPSWKLRTSMLKGISNEQWGYLFEIGIEPARAAALIEELAKKGYTDKGSRRADRIMRLPGSINTRKEGFVAKLLEFEGQLYTYSKICTAFDITPSDTPPLSTGPTTLPDGMIDPIDQWNHDNDRVTGPPRVTSEGKVWYPVTCPREHEHTEVNKGTGYTPGLPGAFKCLHSHGDELTTSWYRKWIREQDPDADLSITPTLTLEALGGRLREIFGTVSTTKAPTADSIRQYVLADYIKVDSESAYWRVSGKCLVKDRDIDFRMYATMLRVGLLDRENDEGEPLAPMAPSTWLKGQLDHLITARIIHRVGQPIIVDDCLNIAPPLPRRWLADIEAPEPEPWLDAVSFVCKDIPRDIELVLDWLAMTVTVWDEKPGWHLLFKGEQGVGKNLVTHPAMRYLEPDHWDQATTDVIASGFTTFLAKRLVQADELQMNTRGSDTGHDIYQKIKAWTARGQNLVMINDKHIKRYSALNLSCWVVTSNGAVPLPLERGDRRFLVIETPRIPWPNEDYEEIYRWLDQEGGNARVINWLQQRWDAMPEARRQMLRGRAPDTEAKQALIIGSSDGIEGAVRLAIEGHADKPWPNLMTATDVMFELEHNPHFRLVTKKMRDNINTQRVGLALRAAGAVQLFGGQPVKGSDRKNMRIWCLRSSMVQMYEAMGQGQKLIDRYRQEHAGAKSWADNEDEKHQQ